MAQAAETADREILDRWWRAFAATGRLPADLELVQGRLVRAVFRGTLPSGPVYVKVMTFPRVKDRLRYLLRELPAVHEARLLRATAAAGIACPEVVDARSERRWLWPSRSMLVLRALVTRPPVATRGAEPDPRARLVDEAATALRLLAAGILHRDLHSSNFVRLTDGTLAVLDLQSATLRCRPCAAKRSRIAVAARLVRERPELEPAVAAAALVQAGLVRDAVEGERVRLRAARERERYWRSRIRRCLQESTEFTRCFSFRGCLYRTRGELGEGRWLHGGRELRMAWLGQRARHLSEGRPPLFPAFFQNWWWRGGGTALYVPRACSEGRIEVEVQEASAGFVPHAHPRPDRGPS
ncbi:MAG TPA: lipopolysaccharide kinase InaA family protein [Planctomycetota bacterium]|nr:lipopolysaccharide kinase InaA family protein [Planctomycetota bacterium]